MTPQEAKNLKPGQYVDYLDIRAMVRAVRTNGVVIDFWGRGLQEGRVIVRRVAASTLKVL